MTALGARTRHADERSGWNRFLPSWDRTADETRGDRLATAAVGLCTALLGAAVALYGKGSAVAVCVGIVTLVVTPGCAVACWLTTGERLGRVNIVLAAGLSWSIIVTTVLAQRQNTSLGVLLTLTAGAGGAVSTVFLIAQLARGRGGASVPAGEDQRRGHSGWDDQGGVRERGDRGGDPRWDDTRADLRWDDRRADPRWDDRRPPGRDYPRGRAERDYRENPASRRDFGTGPRPRPTDTADPSPPSKLPLILGIAGLVVVVGLLAVTVHRATGHAIGNYGLLPLFGPPFYAAVVITIVVFVFAIRFVRTAWFAAIGALGLLAFELNGSQMLIVTTPAASWAYKHFGVVDYVLHGGVLNDPLDVYQQWPGFFALAAGLVRLSGRSPLAYGNWAGVFFVLLNAVTVFAIARRFSRGRRIVPYVAVLLFLVVNWEGQEYFSPQTTAFELALLFQLFLLPFLETDRVRPWLANRRWLGISPVTPLVIPGQERADAAGKIMKGIGLVAVFAVIAVTHQLSPYIVFAGVAALWILGVLRNRWVLLALIVVIVGYPLLHLAAVDKNSILTGLNFSNATGTKGAVTQTTPQQNLASELARLVTLGLWGGTAVSGLSYWRRLGVVIIPLLLAVMPLSLVLASSYGGEGIYRAFLFSSPWCAIVIATRVADLVRAPVFRLFAVATWALSMAFASAQSGDFGQFGILVMPAEEVTASAYFLDHAPVNSTLVQVASNFPGRVNGRYVLHNPGQVPNDPGLDTLPAYEGNGLKNMSAKVLALSVTKLVKGNAYLVIAPSMYPLVNYFGTFAPGTLPAVEQRLMTSPYWKVWYDKGGTVIFQAVPQGTPVVKNPVVKGKDSQGSKKKAG